MDRPGGLSAIGNTPVVRLARMAGEKIRTMRAFGAEVELIPSPEGITPDLIPAMTRARRASGQDPRPARTWPPR
jgi:cysteine synthase